MHISNSLQFGGLERIIRNFAAYLDPKSYRFSACALDSDGIFGDEVRGMGLDVFSLEKRAGLDFRIPIRLYNLFRNQRIDLVHTHNFGPLLYAAVPARLAGVRVIVHTEHARTTFPDTPRRMTAERWLSRMVDCITAVSPQVKQDLVQYERIDPNRIQVIWNGIEPEPFSAADDKGDLRQKLGIESNAPVIGVCCRLTAQKGVRYLIEAVPAILSCHPKATFLIVGDGDLRSELQKLVEDLGLISKVIFTGFRSDMCNILRVLDIYVLPSLFEGTSLGLLEAMLARKTIVVTRVGSNADLIEDFVSGTLVDPKRPDQLAHAINNLLANPLTMRRMEQQAWKRVQSDFLVEKMMRQYEAVYMALIERTSSK
jgi:glycosyltransferase involved in cell wall biosynthesis